MKLYLISRTDSIDWNEYIEFVVAAQSEENALKWFPNGELPSLGSWALYRQKEVKRENLEIEHIGESNSLVEKVITYSYNAG
jgi:hypothetical protein